MVLAQTGEPAVAALSQAMKDKNPRVRIYAARALGQIADPRVMKPLVAALRDEDWNVQAAAIEAIAAIKDPAHIKFLVDAPPSDDPKVRAYVVELLARSEDPRRGAAAEGRPRPVRRRASQGDRRACPESRAGARAVLLAALRDHEFQVQQAAIDGLTQLQDRSAVPQILAMLKDKEWSVRWNAARVLGWLDDPRAVAPLIELLPDPRPEIRRSAADGLGRLAIPAPPSRSWPPCATSSGRCDAQRPRRSAPQRPPGSAGPDRAVEERPGRGPRVRRRAVGKPPRSPSRRRSRQPPKTPALRSRQGAQGPAQNPARLALQQANAEGVPGGSLAAGPAIPPPPLP